MELNISSPSTSGLLKRRSLDLMHPCSFWSSLLNIGESTKHPILPKKRRQIFYWGCKPLGHWMQNITGSVTAAGSEFLSFFPSLWINICLKYFYYSKNIFILNILYNIYWRKKREEDGIILSLIKIFICYMCVCMCEFMCQCFQRVEGSHVGWWGFMGVASAILGDSLTANSLLLSFLDIAVLMDRDKDQVLPTEVAQTPLEQ